MINIDNISKSGSDEVVIDVQHVSMEFNMASEQLNSLKEYAIQIAKRQLFFKGFKALDDVSFQVHKGDVFGIVGTNGSGKSTMLKIVAGVLEPSSGKCTIKGNIAPLIELGAGFDPELSARENIYLNGALLGYSREFIDEKFDEIVAFAEIEQFLDMPLKNYSSGMTARIAFAVATIIVPDILIVDEVLSVGDFMFQRKCENRIRTLIEQHGTTVLIVSHSNELIDSMCNKAVWIEKGHMKMLGDAKEISSAYKTLGGRAGKPESESYLTKLVEHMREENQNEINKRQNIIAGKDFLNTALEATSRVYTKSDRALLCGSNTHVNPLLAASLSNGLDSPILYCQDEYLSEDTINTFKTMGIKNVCAINQYPNSETTKNALKELQNVTLENHIYLHKLLDASIDTLYKYKDSFNWGRTLVIIDFDNNTEAFAIAPYIFIEKCPIVLTQQHENLPFDRIDKILSDFNIAQVILIGQNSCEVNKSHFVKRNIDVVSFNALDSQANCIEIFTWGIAHTKFNLNEICIGNAALDSWHELLVSINYCGKRKTPLLLVDNNSLDNLVSCLKQIKLVRKQKTKLTFFGTSIDEDTRNMFTYQLYQD